jgi:Berberine and berberine like
VSGGAVNDVDPDATAYPHRHQNFNVSSVGADAGRFRALWDELRPYLDGLYLSFETDQRPQRLRDAFPGPTLTRLRELKAVYDPQNVFSQNFRSTRSYDRPRAGCSTDEPSQRLARSASSTSCWCSPTGRPRLSSAFRIRYWTVFLCSISRSAVVL